MDYPWSYNQSDGKKKSEPNSNVSAWNHSSSNNDSRGFTSPNATQGRHVQGQWPTHAMQQRPNNSQFTGAPSQHQLNSRNGGSNVSGARLPLMPPPPLNPLVPPPGFDPQLLSRMRSAASSPSPERPFYHRGQPNYHPVGLQPGAVSPQGNPFGAQHQYNVAPPHNPGSPYTQRPPSTLSINALSGKNNADAMQISTHSPLFALSPSYSPQIDYRRQHSSGAITSSSTEMAWLREWERARRPETKSLTEKTPETNYFKIHEMKEALARYDDHLQVLRRYQQFLLDNEDASTADWQDMSNKINDIKGKLEVIRRVYLTEEQVELTGKQLKMRLNKRNRLKRRKVHRLGDAIEKEEERQKREQEIDEWRSKMLAKILSKRVVESMKTEAGETLAEVKKKQVEMTRQRDFVNSLAELRQLRRETSLKRGIFVLPEHDDRFERRLGKVDEILTQQSRTYKDEEVALRVMMEEEQEDIQRQEREKRRKERQDRRDGLESILEGCRRYWRQADDGVQPFVQIRRMWDMYVIPPSLPGGSSVPGGWVAAPTPSSKEWSRYLQKR